VSGKFPSIELCEIFLNKKIKKTIKKYNLRGGNDAGEKLQKKT
jgi:hypothetical protein